MKRRSQTVEERCPMCGSPGELAHSGLEDRLFGVPGQYQLDRCTDADCGLIWLHDMPSEEGTAAFYANYYTHAAPRPPGRQLWKRIVKRLWPIGAQNARRRELDAFLLPDAGGSVLEGGCGSGDNLARLRERGWAVTGQDIDPATAEVARRNYDIDVVVAPLRQAQFSERFDAILLNHVVEHLRQPVEDLAACRRALADGGRVVIITPNVDSFGARLFGSRWRGLEPPRHLFLYDVTSLRRRLVEAGFADIDVFTRGARTEAIARDSFLQLIPLVPDRVRWVVARGLGMVVQVVADVARVDAHDRGDELVAVARG